MNLPLSKPALNAWMKAAFLILLMGCRISPKIDKEFIELESVKACDYNSFKEMIDEMEFIIIDTMETTFSKIDKIIVNDSINILLVGKVHKQVLVCNRSGKLIGKIDRLGGGPGEYKKINDITYNYQTGEIIIWDIVTTSLYAFDISGKFIWQKKLEIYADNLITDDNNYYFYTDKLVSKLAKDKEVIVFNKSFELVNSYFHFTDHPNIFRYSAEEVFSRDTQGNIIFSNAFRDTVYQITPKSCSPYIIYLFNDDIPQKFTRDINSYNNHFRDYTYNLGSFCSNADWNYFNIVKKGYLKDFYHNKETGEIFETTYSQVSSTIYLGNPVGSYGNCFYYSILPEWIDNLSDFHQLLIDYQRPDLVNYFNKNILHYNPIIARVILKTEINTTF